MPADLTIFAAQDLVFIALALAVLVIAFLALHRSQAALIHWAIASGVLLALSFLLAQLAGALYSDPRPFTSEHIQPLIAHAPDNGFPSDHALLAAALVALVGLLSIRWALPFVSLTVLIDWARVGAGIHHVTDVLGSSLIVAVATLLGVLVAKLLADRLAAHLPEAWRPAHAQRHPGR
jgi:membrane-associated phospholipid phosphatase